MKKKNVTGKLTLKKQDFAQLGNNEMDDVKGGNQVIGGLSLFKTRKNSGELRRCSGCLGCWTGPNGC